MSRRKDVALFWWRQLFQRPASFPPLPNVINGDRIQHHTLKPQPKVCKTSAETRWEGPRETKKNANRIWETYLEVGRQRSKKEKKNKADPTLEMLPRNTYRQQAPRLMVPSPCQPMLSKPSWLIGVWGMGSEKTES